MDLISRLISLGSGGQRSGRTPQGCMPELSAQNLGVCDSGSTPFGAALIVI